MPMSDGPAATMRLNKALAHAGVCARRKADELVFAGRVAVNGEVVTEPGRQVVVNTDRITVDGRPIGGSREPCCLMVHKPVRMVSTVSDPEGRPTVLELAPEAYRARRLYPVGRLDFFSEGLLLLTDDGDLAHKLAHPRHHLPKQYEVRVRGRVPEAALVAMRKGMILAEGERLAPVEAKAVPQGRDTVLHLTLHQGVNRQIRRMCRDLDVTILRLTRTGFGPLTLAGLEPGGARPLNDDELRLLRGAVHAAV